MVRDELEREQDIEELRRLALAIEAQNRLLLEALAKSQREVSHLRGKPSGDVQLTLKMLEELKAKAKATHEAIERAANKTEKKPRSSSGPTAQPNLPIVERTFVLDAPDRTCTSCGGELHPMKDQFEESEMIDVIEVRYELVKVKQQKYVCRCGGCVETALGPTRALPGSRYSLAFAIKVLIDKWMDHIPLERQVRILERHGLVVTSQTLWDLAYAVAQRLSLVDAALFQHVKAQPVIGLDQTGWPRLEAESSKPWQMWCLTAPGVVVHRIRDDKSAATFKELVGDYAGTIVADALGTHEAGAREGPGIALAGCWAHYLEPSVIWRGGRRSVGGRRRLLKIIPVNRSCRSTSLGCASNSDAGATRRAGKGGDRDLARGWPWHRIDGHLLGLGTAVAVALA